MMSTDIFRLHARKTIMMRGNRGKKRKLVECHFKRDSHTVEHKRISSMQGNRNYFHTNYNLHDRHPNDIQLAVTGMSSALLVRGDGRGLAVVDRVWGLSVNSMGSSCCGRASRDLMLERNSLTLNRRSSRHVRGSVLSSVSRLRCVSLGSGLRSELVLLLVDRHGVCTESASRAVDGLVGGLPGAKVLLGHVEDFSCGFLLCEGSVGVAGHDGGVVEQVEQLAGVLGQQDLLLGALNVGGHLDVVGLLYLLACDVG